MSPVFWSPNQAKLIQCAASRTLCRQRVSIPKATVLAQLHLRPTASGITATTSLGLSISSSLCRSMVAIPASVRTSSNGPFSGLHSTELASRVSYLDLHR